LKQMRAVSAAMLLVLVHLALLAQNSASIAAFEVASVKPSQHPVGKDAETHLSIGATGVSGKNLTLKQLILEAYELQPHQVSGPNWIDAIEYDVEARAGGPASSAQLRLMLRALLTERFGLAMHQETKELSVYELVVDKNGPKIHPTTDSKRPAGGSREFRGTLQQFANLLSVKLSIPVMDDPGRPGMARGTPVPVLDKTELSGVYDIPSDLRPEPGGDMFALWQRLLQDQLGLKLEARKAKVEIWVVDRAARVPTAN
jgi:uncharacterized protein (TIGR03435 family)